MIFDFINNNLGTVINKLKESGLSLTASALQNDDNIAKVASIIHGALPMAMRIFISLNTVEEFLLKNRYWLIEKLK